MPDLPTLITTARQRLTTVNTHIDVIQQNLSAPSQPLLDATISMRDGLVNLGASLQDIVDDLDEYLNALVNPTSSTLTQWQTALDLLQITLTVSSSGIGGDAGWSRDEDRVKNAYISVYQIISRLSALLDNDTGQAILLFLDAFGGVSLQLTQERISGQTPYAETENPGGNIIFLYLDPDTERTQADIDRGYIVHTPANIIHEFGHVLVFRSGGNSSGIFQEWQNTFWSFISDFDTNQGWAGGADGSDFKALANRARRADVVDGVLTADELENERIANLFQAFILGYQPDIDGNQPAENTLPEKQRRAAWAMQSFMTGTCPPSDVHIDLTEQTTPCGQGLIFWIIQLGNTR